MQTRIEDRKINRKQKRSEKKRKKQSKKHSENGAVLDVEGSEENAERVDGRKQVIKNDIMPTREAKQRDKRHREPANDDLYSKFDDSTAHALRRDDDEIAALEAKLGLKGSKGKDRLRKEYGMLEGFGDDFGKFLDDLDGIMEKVVEPTNRRVDPEEDHDNDSLSTAENEKPTKRLKPILEEVLDEDTKAALQRDDEEISALEAKLGIPGGKAKNKLHKEFESEDRFGDGVGTFLDGLDQVVKGARGPKGHSEAPVSDSDNEGPDKRRLGDESSSTTDDVVPMKSVTSDDSASCKEQMEHTLSDTEDENKEIDHDTRYTYSPADGEDIYGNTITAKSVEAPPLKYVPPHLRKQKPADPEADESRQQRLQIIRRSLNSSLNRLSMDSIVSVSQSVSELYASYPTSDINDCLWENATNACISRIHLTSALTPMYVAALAGVHVLKGDSSQLGGFLMEQVVTKLWEELKIVRGRDMSNDVSLSNDDLLEKEAANYTLFLCYMYNFGIIHCTLIYDIIRNFLDTFKEIDIELILIILRHSGRSLRTDDPSALKDIVLLVQKNALENAYSQRASRVDFMVSAIIDLKNNKRRNQRDAAYVEKTSKLRRLIGQIKTKANSTHGFQAVSMLHRVSLDDILNAGTKGRYWRVGASWAGNQFSFHDEEKASISIESKELSKTKSIRTDADLKLLRLAEKYRMNSEIRRSIFCIMMGAADCDDSFEKLVRADMLKNRTERETVRVLLECCGNEKAFNKFWLHLAVRICEFQPQSKFSFQLAFWDIFKTIEEAGLRRAANLSKLLFYLVVVHRCLRLNVLKPIDLASPEDLSEKTALFVTMFFSSMMDYFQDPLDVTMFFETSLSRKRTEKMTDEQLEQMDEVDSLCASFSVFFIQVLKASPKNEKKSIFRSNLKAAIKACDADGFY